MAQNKKHRYTKKMNGKNNVGAKEKYTKEFCFNELNEMIKYMESEDGSDVVLIVELCLYRGYSKQRWSEISNKFTDCQEISELIKKIENTLEARLYKAGLTNQVNPTMCIFGLKNKYQWHDRIEQDITSKDEKIKQVFVIGGQEIEI
jgi:hypothetical protein